MLQPGGIDKKHVLEIRKRITAWFKKNDDTERVGERDRRKTFNYAGK